MITTVPDKNNTSSLPTCPSKQIERLQSLNLIYPDGVQSVVPWPENSRFCLATEASILKFEEFIDNNDLRKYGKSFYLIAQEIFADVNFDNYSNELEVHSRAVEYFFTLFTTWIQNLRQVSNTNLSAHLNARICGNQSSVRPEVQLSILPPLDNQQRIVVVEISYGVNLEATHRRLQDTLTLPGVIAGIIVRIKYPQGSRRDETAPSGRRYDEENADLIYFYYPRPVPDENGNVPRATPTVAISFGYPIGLQDRRDVASIVGCSPEIFRGNCNTRPFHPISQIACTYENRMNPTFIHSIPDAGIFTLNGQGTILNNVLDLNQIQANQRLQIRLYELKLDILNGIQAMNRMNDQVPFVAPVW